MNLTPATEPTMYFIGVTTGASSIMKVFPEWAKALGINAVMKGICVFSEKRSAFHGCTCYHAQNRSL